MPSHFDLIVTADNRRIAEFQLLDGDGSQLAFRQTDFSTIPVSRLQGLFDLGDYVRLYVEGGKELAAVAEIGTFIAEELLGPEIFKQLWESESQRTLRIQLPGAAEQENPLVTQTSEVRSPPWPARLGSSEQARGTSVGPWLLPETSRQCHPEPPRPASRALPLDTPDLTASRTQGGAIAHSAGIPPVTAAWTAASR